MIFPFLKKFCLISLIGAGQVIPSRATLNLQIFRRLGRVFSKSKCLKISIFWLSGRKISVSFPWPPAFVVPQN
ncbi:hypothetical protein, partial [Duodenibacillus massiliensis]|uniref:hypothetical protein n=1 Tax=Duodenibacillus massiliensis TaxID=1852381 RepID=UPI003AF7EDD8